MSRRDARERAFQLLYQLSVQVGDVDQQVGEFMSNMGDYHDGKNEILYSEEDRAYILQISAGFRFHLEQLDDSFSPHLKDWTKERLPKVDLAILRLAACEVLFINEIPLSVSINEAVLLAKKYAAPESRSYINGVLGNLTKADPSATPEEPSANPIEDLEEMLESDELLADDAERDTENDVEESDLLDDLASDATKELTETLAVNESTLSEDDDEAAEEVNGAL